MPSSALSNTLGLAQPPLGRHIAHLGFGACIESVHKACPRLHITQTSSEGYGQIYVGFVNWALMALTLGLALTFRSSENLGRSYPRSDDARSLCV